MYVQSNNFNIIYSLFFYTYRYVLTLSSVSLCQEVQRRSLKMGYEKCYHHEKKYAPLLLPLSSLSVLVHVFIDIFLNWFISLNVKYFINYNLFFPFMAFLLISLLYSLLGSLCVQQRSLKVEYIQCH